MKQSKSQKKAKGAKRGPKPEIVKIDMDWSAAIRKSLQKKVPETGWPKPD